MPEVIVAIPSFRRPLGLERLLPALWPALGFAGLYLAAALFNLFKYIPWEAQSLLLAATVTAIALVSYTAMAGVVGAGGLGDLAIRFGYQRFQTDVMVVTVVLLLVLVQALQMVGDAVVRR